MSEKKKVVEHAERNKEPILKVLQKYIPKDQEGTLFEVSSGTGQHVTHFASYFSKLQFYPTDITTECLDSIKEHILDLKLTNVHEPFLFNITNDLNKDEKFDFILNINMIHISPWETCQGLMKFCKIHLKKYLFMYGPYMIDGKHNSKGNEEFDISLKKRNELWGLRDVNDVVKEANKNGLELVEKVAMPSNNFILIFKLSE